MVVLFTVIAYSISVVLEFLQGLVQLRLTLAFRDPHSDETEELSAFMRRCLAYNLRRGSSPYASFAWPRQAEGR